MNLMKYQTKKLGYFLAAYICCLFSSHTIAQNSATGAWSSIYTADMIPVACANLPNGKILSWSAFDRYDFSTGDNGQTYVSIFDPANNSFSTTLVSHTEHDMFCPGTANIGTGEIVITGGSSSPNTTIYDPISNTFRAGQDMNTPRGYHSTATLSDGRVFAVGGSWSGGKFNKQAEVWSPTTGWITLDDVDSNETVRQGAPDPKGIYRNDNHAWLWAGPNERVFHAGPGTDMHWITTTGTGSVTDVGTRGGDAYSMNGTSVMYDEGKILTCGGAESYETSEPASNRSYSIDISGGGVSVSQSGDMNQARTLHNSVVLPSGEVVVVGGMCKSKLFSDGCAVLEAEIWNPNTDTWTELDAMQVPRTYHSVAILMQDGRVWAGGGGLCGDCDYNHPDAEIFTPPYLYSGNALATRPVINSAPTTADYNSNISVSTNTGVQEFVLVRLSSATHSINNEQRRIPLTFSGNGGNNYTVNIPSNDWLPPGNYYLFAMDDGVPSIAKTIRIGGQEPENQQTVPNGTYFIESFANNQHVASPTFDADNARTVDQSDDDNQKWIFTHLEDDVYTVRNASNNRYLGVSDADCTNGTSVATVASANDDNAQWYISRDGDEFFFRPVHCTTQAMDRTSNNNSSVHTWNYSIGNENQRFILKPTVADGRNENGLNATYYDEINLTGTTVTRVDDIINFNWGEGSPDPAIGPETFSARWQGSIESPSSGTYTFYTRTDDGVRLWVDGQLIIDNWIDQRATELSATIQMTAGERVSIKMEYYENIGDALAQLSWEGPGVTKQIIPNNYLYRLIIDDNGNGGDDNGLNATYYNNIDFTGNTLERVDETINFNWGTGSPDAAIANDTYSVVWEGSLEAPSSGAYTFYTRTDDGVRLWVDGQLIIDRWVNQAPTEVSATIQMTAGERVAIRMEYYENGSGAVAQLSWAAPGVAKQIIPSEYLFAETVETDGRLIVNGTYIIRSKANGQNAAGPSTDNFNVSRAAAAAVDASHQWVFEHLGDGEHSIRNVGTDRYLTVESAVCGNGGNIRTSVSANADHKKWYVELIDGNYYLIPIYCPTQAMDRNRDNNPNIHTWTFNTTNLNTNQQWDLIPQNGSVVPREELIEKDLRATPILGQRTQLNWYVTQITHKQATQYTFQHYHDEYEDFQDIEVATATDYMGLAQYKFVHENPQLGENYYQVKIDFEDGTTDYSHFRLVVFEPDAATINIAPNPARDELRIDLANYMDEPIHYFVSSITGQVILHDDYNQNHNEIEAIDLTDFSNGTYIIYLRPTGGREIAKKFVVLKSR